MKLGIIAFLAGFLMSIGLTLSQMVNPNKVLNFLDFFGHWDASLIFVMVGAIALFMLVFFLFIRKRTSSILHQTIMLPNTTLIDRKLIIGATIFGIGWGMAGICPGPALVNLLTGNIKIFGFIIMMLIGMAIADPIQRGLEKL